MDQYLDLSVRNFTPHFTRRAKEHGLRTQILVKVPAWDLTTVRLIGTNFEITEFLRVLTLAPDSTLTERAVRMHVQAIKPLTEQAPHWKNRTLTESRAK